MNTHYASFLLAIALAPVSALAQTLDNASISPQVGESFTYNAAPWVVPGPEGASQTWNHASLPTGATQSHSYVTPASTGYGGTFPTSNVADNNGNGAYGFYNTSASGIDLVGAYSGASGVTIPYQNPERILNYPLSYNGSWSDNLTANFTTNGFPVVRAGSISGQADAYGTLIMPYGTVNNVLRVRTIEDYSDDVDGLYTIDYYFVNHYYYKPGTHAPLMAHYDQSTTLLGNETISQSVIWLAGGPTGVMEALVNDIGIDVFPNPATEQASIVFSSNGGTIQLELTDAMGRLVRQDSHAGMHMGIERIYLDVQDLPAGIYQVRIRTADGQQGVQRMVVQ